MKVCQEKISGTSNSNGIVLTSDERIDESYWKVYFTLNRWQLTLFC